MPIITPPNPETRKIVSLVTDLEQRMRRAEAGLRAAQLKNASITGGGLNIYDDDGVIRTVLGRQSDGSYTAVSTNNPNPPPVPAAPQALPALASAIVRHTGETASGVGWPADLKALNIYYALAQNPDDWVAGGSLGTSWPEELPIAPLEYTDYLVCVTSVNHSGKESAKSEPVSVSPKQVVPNDLIADIFTDLELSAGVVTEAALAAGAVTETKIAPDSIASPMVKAGAILGVHVAADQIDGGKLTAQAITARELRALAVVAGKIDVNAVTAGTIAAGAVTAVKLEANLVIANRFVAGSLSGNRVELHPLQGLQAYTGGGTTRSFWIDAATGTALLIGEIRTAATGARIIMNPDGTRPDRIQFWPDAVGGTADFAYIDSFPVGATGTGIVMQASGGQTNKVGTVWLLNDFARLGLANTDLRPSSQFYAEPGFVRCRSGIVDLMVDMAISPAPNFGQRRVAFIHANTSDQPILPTQISYMQAADGRPWFVGNYQNSGLKFDADAIAVTDGNSMTFGPISASAFFVQSSESTKEDIGKLRLADGRTSLDLIETVQSKEWRYRESPQPDCDQEDGVEGTPRSRHRHRFPIAEELQKIDPSLVVKGSGDNLQVDLRDMIGILWDAVGRLTKRVRELETETETDV